MPELLLYRAVLHWSLSAMISIAAACALAIIPAKLAAPQTERALRELTSGDFRKPLPRKPEHIELVRPSVSYAQKGDDPVEHAACDELCQRLLLTHQVATVTVSARVTHGEPILVTYSLATMTRCPTAFDIGTRVLPSTTYARVAGTCITPSRGLGMVDGISIRYEELARRSIPSFSLSSVKRARRLEVLQKRDRKDFPLPRTTEVAFRSATGPFMVFPYARVLTSVSGVGISKTSAPSMHNPCWP